MNDQIIINDGETQWIHLVDMNEVQIIHHDPEDEMMNPKNLFTIFKKGYKYQYVGKYKGDINIINMFPEESNDFIKVELIVNTKRNQLEKMMLFDKNGGIYTYLITSFISNSEELPLFNFNIMNYPDIEVIDLR